MSEFRWNLHIKAIGSQSPLFPKLRHFPFQPVEVLCNQKPWVLWNPFITWKLSTLSSVFILLDKVIFQKGFFFKQPIIIITWAAETWTVRRIKNLTMAKQTFADRVSGSWPRSYFYWSHCEILVLICRKYIIGGLWLVKFCF